MNLTGMNLSGRNGHLDSFKVKLFFLICLGVAQLLELSKLGEDRVFEHLCTIRVDYMMD